MTCFRFSFAPRWALLGATLLLLGCGQDAPDPTAPTRDDHLALGNPSGAITDATQPTNYLIVRPQYALSYHRDRGTPNWVSWHLSPAWLGTAARQDNFTADNTLPTGWYRPTSSSYTGSGFDRGHQCPSADRTASAADNAATFVLSNIIPQAPNNNQRTWVGLENYSRTLVGQGNELYIICGSYGRGGTGSEGRATTIDQGRITVPARCWKVVVVLPIGTNDASRITSSTRVIAIDLPNSNTVNEDWSRYRTSVDAIEQATGLDLLSAVSTAVQATLEAQVDKGPTQ